ncbi:cupin domain-containing protein [Larkinella arboricola]
MAHQGKEIYNPKTGQLIQFIKTRTDTNGEFLELISTYEPGSKEPLPHYHPHQDEYFDVLQGELSVRLNGNLQILKPGDQIHIQKTTVHAMWNATNNKSVVRWRTVPALDTEHLLELNVGLVNDGKTNKDGVPNLLQVALMMMHYNHVFRLAQPPYPVQRVIFMLLTPVARLMGYKPYYKKYLD